uniref:Uncharacterized protein n=1 Tax=Hyaloperonospora arabidopsidis (strain Emoy2) TaxID=559515 RepID=M4B7Z4_HYAAE
MGRKLWCVAGVALAALLLAVMAAVVRLVMLVVHLVTLRYTLVIGSMAFTLWFGLSRRQRCARGFYSCSQVPPVQQTERAKPISEEQEEEGETQKLQLVAAVLPLAGRVMDQLKKVATTAPSETESEDDEIEAAVGHVANVTITLPSSNCGSSASSGHDKRLADVWTRRDPMVDELLQQRRSSRPRSSSAFDDSRYGRVTARSTDSGRRVDLNEMESMCGVARRRADTGLTTNNNNKVKQHERVRRATFMSKKDTHAVSRSDRLEEARGSDGYWIGDFSMQRRLVSRRSYNTSPKAN